MEFPGFAILPSLTLMLSPFTAVGAHRAFIDFTLSNARRDFTRQWEPLGSEGAN